MLYRITSPDGSLLSMSSPTVVSAAFQFTGSTRSAGVVAAQLLHQEAKAWWITRLSVEPQARRKKIGQRLVRRIFELAEQSGIPIVMAKPEISSTPREQQIAFLRSVGFTPVLNETDIMQYTGRDL
jgi:N-acetylglutamate synthase-like GNAT family acetyltransferase